MFTISNLLKRGANYLLMVLLARDLAVYTIGLYSAYVNIIGVLLLLTNFGFSEYLLVNSENEDLRKRHTVSFLHISFVVFALISIICLFIPVIDLSLLLLVLLKIFLETSIYNILLAYYQVTKRLRIMSITNIVSGVLIVFTCGVAYYLEQPIYVYLICINIIHVLILFAHLRKIQPPFQSLTRIFLFIRERFLDLKYYGISMVTVPIYMMAPTVIGSFLLDKETLAYYQIAFSIANILLLVSVSLLQEGYVKFLINKDNIIELTKDLKRTGLKIISVNIIFLAVFLIFGKELILLVYKKEEYLDAYYPLLILLLSNTIFMFASIAAVIMVVLKLQKEKAKYHIEFIVASVFFGFLLTYFFGIYGLASSYIILYSYSTIRYTKKYIKIYRNKTVR